jgi:predicted nucleic acid-binding protein
MNKIFLDINVVLDLINPSRERHNTSIKLLNLLIRRKYQIVISEDCISTVFYISNNKSKVLKFFLKIQHNWIISKFGSIVINDALNLSLAKNLDLEDILQCLCAKNNNCDIFITNDTTFHNCGINIQTPQQFINEHSNS